MPEIGRRPIRQLDGGTKQRQPSSRSECRQRLKSNKVRYETESDVVPRTAIANLIERRGRQNRLITADDDAVGADAVDGKLFDASARR